MRLLIAPDSFTGSLTAREAARALAEGFARAGLTEDALCRNAGLLARRFRRG